MRRPFASAFRASRCGDNEVGYYERGAGYLRPEACVAAQLRLAEEHGATLHRDERVTAVEAREGGVRGAHGSRPLRRARSAIIAAGPWIHELVPREVSQHLTVTRQLLFWFDVEAAGVAFHAAGVSRSGSGSFRTASHAIYGFPAIDGPHGGVKIATEQYAKRHDTRRGRSAR